VFATAFHEPENDMTGPEFVAFQRHVYRVVKDANPTIRWGPVYMAYWWDPAEPDHYVGDPAAWWPGEEYADFVGIDWYGADPEPMTASPSFGHWYDVMAPTGLPVIIAEYGQAVVRPGTVAQPEREAARARAIRQDAAWIEAHPQVSGWLYWHGPGPRGQWRLTDEESRRAWRDVAASADRSTYDCE
jgi:beta-mannanase